MIVIRTFHLFQTKWLSIMWIIHEISWEYLLLIAYLFNI